MYRQCPICGAYLDPCEPCDCQDDPDDDENKKAAMPTSTAANPPQKETSK